MKFLPNFLELFLRTNSPFSPETNVESVPEDSINEKDKSQEELTDGLEFFLIDIWERPVSSKVVIGRTVKLSETRKNSNGLLIGLFQTISIRTVSYNRFSLQKI